MIDILWFNLRLILQSLCAEPLFFPVIWQWALTLTSLQISEVDLRGGAPSPSPLYFLQSFVFCNHFEELETKLFEVEVIFNNAPLIYVYPNTVKTCLTPNYLLFGWQLLLSFNTTSTGAANLTVLLSTTDKINCISNHFWDRWRHDQN